MGDAAYYRAVEASERRLSELRAANRESVRRVQDKITNEQTQHQARMAEKEQKIHDDQLRNSNSNVAKKNAADI
ncbi:Protein containing ALS2cr12 (ALS2CR12) signature [Caenorhabditis elegans]|uniref:Protein containing ALS2cr12 (ALS2CR12) signature n=1 Tax=Caenorhabditis elegans TaxID=6239 RepID=I2FLU3_CAEEL|nr:Protein containing ALS2cr12 (ALS2CR12) signature [Caenorhabditis elegans]CCE71307.2 Protein containing ALS2cr12 (ALS2CR12) signature [Caenorhabditis elegans]|eukprot:NP_001263565.1 Protein containing ALS2cr12 (ALS2CR12) signature [Caenorhabditis elegans]